MSQRTVTVDGKSISTDGSIIRDVVRDKRAVAARVGGRLVDLSAPLDEGQDIETVPADSDEGVHIIRHSAAHVMAEAVKQLFPTQTHYRAGNRGRLLLRLRPEPELHPGRPRKDREEDGRAGEGRSSLYT